MGDFQVKLANFPKLTLVMPARLTHSNVWEILQVPKYSSAQIQELLTTLTHKYEELLSLGKGHQDFDITEGMIQRLEIEQVIRERGYRARETEELEELEKATTDKLQLSAIRYEMELRWVTNRL
jgi:hypothetical protein